MVRVLIAGILALIISIALGPRFIRFLREREYGQQIREEGPSHHITKQGTPTMGGVLIVVAMAIPFLALSRVHDERAARLLRHAQLRRDRLRRRLHEADAQALARPARPLEARCCSAAITAVVAYVTHHRDFETKVYLPVINGKLPLSWAWYVLLFFIIAGAANGVNLTDGLDGLAAGTGIIAVFTFTAMAVIAWIRSGAPGHRDEIYLDLAIFGAALIGAIVGFLWYNAWPAEVFMGDTGAMAIGGALAAFAIVMKTEFLLLLIGGIFLIEALSVIIQVVQLQPLRAAASS